MKILVDEREQEKSLEKKHIFENKLFLAEMKREKELKRKLENIRKHVSINIIIIINIVTCRLQSINYKIFNK